MSRLACGLALAGLLVSSGARALSSDFCDRPRTPSPDQRDVMLRFAAIVRDEIAAAGQPAALIARSGLDLHRLDVRYSHEAVALQDNGDRPWSVRELYFSCDERKPRVYDEGLTSFLLGTDDPDTGFVSVVFLPADRGAALRTTAVDKSHALGVLGASYSANAYPFSPLHQNCNQWVIELLADAWGGKRDADGRERNAGDRDGDEGAGADRPGAVRADTDARPRAQAWLRGQGYLPTVFTVSARPMTWLPALVPWLSNDDHPAEEVAHGRYSVSMPSSIETFVQARVPGAQRVEVCHAGRRVVLHRGWDDIPDGCVPGPGDRTWELSAD